MQKIRVMFVVLQLDAGGSERVVLDLAKNLDPDRFDIFVAAFKGGVLESQLKEICKEIIFINKGKGFDLKAMFHLARIVNRNKIDIINAHHFMPFFYSFMGTKILNRKKLVYTEHSVPEVDEVASSLYGKIFSLMLYQLDTVVGVSRDITAKFKEKYPRHSTKFQAVMNGVDIKRFKGNWNREEVRESWGLSNEHFVVGTVANFRKVKNHVCLLRASARMKSFFPQLRLVFVGRGFSGDSENSKCEILSLIDELELHDIVIFLGFQEDIPKNLSGFDVFCLPSLSEGLPVSLMEAMAARIPVVGSCVRGITELIEAQKNGLLFPSNDDKELALILEGLLDDPDSLKSMVEHAFDFVNTNHSSGAWIKNYSDIFLKINN